MKKAYEIRASYDQKSIVLYQAYSDAIAKPALAENKFVTPFSFNRMTWIKPSFLWLMHRSHWGTKKGQENILAVRIKRESWGKALSLGVLTHPEMSIYQNPEVWRSQFDNAKIHVQWDTERSLRGAGLTYYSIQVGVGRELIEEYVNEWILDIVDISNNVKKIRSLLKSGKDKNVRKLLPIEKVYPVPEKLGKNLMIS
ncbi:hypothetical protein MNBD_GAMMA12-623 [hydrothermal vent metagenome]|uniref:DUF4291 domain-containing protein n=1 Tax=hydrothermal vent metagenome TaxID=652676 RepID=A0A3B0YHH3_9ZZZZ